MSGRARATPASAVGSVEPSFERLGDPAALEPLWTDLERRADPSFFLSWGWIGCWLRTLPKDVRPWVLSLREERKVAALALFVPRRVRRLGALRMGQWWLHETGDPRIDGLTIEDNGILAPRQRADPLMDLALRWLIGNAPDCDEIILGGIRPDQEAAAWRAARGSGFVPRVLRRSVRPYVDLDARRAAGGEYLAGLGRNTRQAIGRALRLYEASGPLRLRIAADPAEAQDYLSRLKRLHQARWTERDRPGAFASPFFERFHRRLIEECLPTGAIQLCRISAGTREIGYLYNFAWGGWVHAYQSGFVYEADNRLKPGLVSHYLAIRHAVEGGLRIYDFMAGDGRHKRSLATGSDAVVWLALTADRLPWSLETALRRAKSRLRASKEAE